VSNPVNPHKEQTPFIFHLNQQTTAPYNFNNCFSSSSETNPATQAALFWTTSSSTIDHHTTKVVPQASNTLSSQVILRFPFF